VQTANVHQAKSQLSKLLDAAERGEEVVITRRGAGVNRFRLVPVVDHRRPRFGALAGQVIFADDYDEADTEIQAQFDESLNR
jgi:prevent-host-death family protein